MTKRYVNKAHVMWVHEQPCVFQAKNDPCEGPIQAHHLLKPWDGERGMGLTAHDRNVLPLCQRHHMMLHDRFGDELEFFYSIANDPEFGKDQASHFWFSSPHYQEDGELRRPPF